MNARDRHDRQAHKQEMSGRPAQPDRDQQQPNKRGSRWTDHGENERVQRRVGGPLLINYVHPSSQQNQNASNPPPPAGGLFGSSTTQQTSQPPPTGGLFGSSTNTSQPQQSGGLFGGSTTGSSQPQQQSRSLFDRVTPADPPQQSQSLFNRITPAQPQQQSGGLFGSGAPASQPQQSSGLFGNTSISQPQQSGGLFGGATTSQPQQSGGLFGSSAANTQQSTGGTGLFGSSQQPQQQQGGSNLFGGANRPSTSLFGGSATNNAPALSSLGNTGGSSLFGGANAQQNQNQASSSLFGGSTTQQQAPTSSIFGLTATAPGQQQPTSLLNASQYRDSQLGSFSGKLTLGQPASTAAQQGTAPGAVQYNYDTMKATTRFGDLNPDIQKELERIDAMIQTQQRYCRDIEAFIPQHGSTMKTIPLDVELIQEKTEAAETALALDAQGVQSERKVFEKDLQDGERIKRVVDNLRQPPQWRVTTTTDANASDLDLIGHYFMPLAHELQQTLNTYVSSLGEVEGHLGVMESAPALRRGVGGGEYTVRELAETLGGFENAILGAAGLVGQCREGMNDLVLGGSYSLR